MGVGSALFSYDALQREKLLDAWRADLPGSTTPHVVLALPSYALDRSVYEHYGDRLNPLENRYLYALLRSCDSSTRVIYVSSLPVPEDVWAGYLDLVDPGVRAAISGSSRIITPEDVSARPLAEKLLDRGDLIDEIRRFIGTDVALIEPWNVSEVEAEFAVAIGAPVNGTHPSLRRLATKSNGRRLMRDAGVPVPLGSEDVRTPDDIARAMADLRRRCPDMHAVVVKVDDSVAGDGNVVIPAVVEDAGAIARLLPGWYKALLADGGIVEERIQGTDFRSPSAQANIAPTGEVTVLATHEQRLGGLDHQVYEGCSFPADPAYASTLGEYAARVGHALAASGALGRFSVDFVAVRQGDGWDVYALEINLRKGGTTHPYGVTRFLRGGAYDAPQGVFVASDGRPTYYGASDNLMDESWVGRSPTEVRSIIRRAGLAFDAVSRTGVVPHLLDCLRVDGRMGYTAIGDDPEQVADLEQLLVTALRR